MLFVFVTFMEPLSDLSRKLSPEDIFSDIRSPQYGRAHGVSLSTQEKHGVQSRASEYEQILVCCFVTVRVGWTTTVQCCGQNDRQVYSRVL